MLLPTSNDQFFIINIQHLTQIHRRLQFRNECLLFSTRNQNVVLYLVKNQTYQFKGNQSQTGNSCKTEYFFLSRAIPSWTVFPRFIIVYYKLYVIT